MGNTHPSGFDEPLAAHPHPVYAVAETFCVGREVNLHIREPRFRLTPAVDIKDANTGAVWFRLNSHNLVRRRVLRDCYGGPVLTIKRKAFRWAYLIYRGDERANAAIKVTATAFGGGSARLFTHIAHPVSGQVTPLVLKGCDFFNNSALVWLGEEKHGGVVVARIGRSFSLAATEYYLTVAEGFDVALCVALCLILDHHRGDSCN